MSGLHSLYKEWKVDFDACYDPKYQNYQPAVQAPTAAQEHPQVRIPDLIACHTVPRVRERRVRQDKMISSGPD
jgi:hypothetical protein